jgi:hypothetical protein
MKYCECIGENEVVMLYYYNFVISNVYKPSQIFCDHYDNGVKDLYVYDLCTNLLLVLEEATRRTPTSSYYELQMSLQ